MIRALRLTDVVAFLALRNRAVLNEALIRPEDIPAIPSLLQSFFRRSIEMGSQTWVDVQGGQIEGVVAVRPRMGGDIWDVDQLLVGPAGDASAVCRELLAHVSAAARDAGVQKVFLRVRADSPVKLSARRAGFFEYARELVYKLPEFTPLPKPETSVFRPRKRAHHHAIFQLYSASVPCPVREMEGMTLHEWRLVDGWGFTPTELRVGLIGLQPRRRDLVLERDGKVVVWAQVDNKNRRLSLLAHPSEPPEVIRNSLLFGLAQFRSAGPIACPVRTYQGQLAGFLEEQGFGLFAEHALLSHCLTVRLPQRQFVPVRA